MDDLKDASVGLANALLRNIRLGCKGLPGANTLAYYKHLQISNVGSFITLGTDYMETNHSTFAKVYKTVA
jgi:hypothetical protein